MSFTKVILITLCAATVSLAFPVPQRAGVLGTDGVFRQYHSGQYTSIGEPIQRAAQRLVPSKAQPLIRVQPQTLKRVRVQPQAQQQVLYTDEVPATNSAASSALRQVQPQLTYVPQQAQQTYIQQPAPTYYVQQRTPTQLISPKLQKTALKSVLPKQQQLVQEEEIEEEYPPDLNPSYNFSFDVKDDELTNYQNRQEEREGNVIKGSYSVVDPDGYVRTVTYTADGIHGFRAKVTREPTDVKVKFPVPTPAPAVDQPFAHKAKSTAPAIRTQAIPQQQPQYAQQQQYSQPVVYQTNPQYTATASHEEPTYVLRRVPGSGNTQRLVKVLRQ